MLLCKRLPLPIRQLNKAEDPTSRKLLITQVRDTIQLEILLLLLSQLRSASLALLSCHSVCYNSEDWNHAGRLAFTSNAWIAELQWAAAARLLLPFAQMGNHSALFRHHVYFWLSWELCQCVARWYETMTEKIWACCAGRSEPDESPFLDGCSVQMEQASTGPAWES